MQPERCAKVRLRRALLAARAGRSPAERARDAERLAAAARSVVQALGAATVTAYVAFGGEPPTDRLLEELRRAGVRVLLPVVLADHELDWAAYDGPERLAPGARGTAEPVGPRLGVEAVAGVDLLLVPALAVGRDGHRLGRGGGSYDRALRRVSAPSLAVVYPGEVLGQVPAEAHDRPVSGALSPDGPQWFSPP